jgi:mitogen-activated protein kinase 1/3
MQNGGAGARQSEGKHSKAVSYGGERFGSVYVMNNETFELDERYHPVKLLGEGTYGIVCLAWDSKISTHVAIKKCRLPRRNYFAYAQRLLREICIVRSIDHPNLLGLKNLMGPSGRFDCVYMVTEAMDLTLRSVTRGQLAVPPSIADIQLLMWQLLHGLSYLHAAGIIHRDIKPANILFSKDCTLKICDFGLARDMCKNKKMTEHVVSRKYRAPEVYVTPGEYTTQIDVWAAGCVLGELFSGNGSALFDSSEGALGHLKVILSVIGLPSREELDAICPEVRAWILSLPPMEKRNLADLVPLADPLGLDLLQKMLQFDPKKRITASEALRHPWFRKLKYDPCFQRLYQRLKYDQLEVPIPGNEILNWDVPGLSEEKLIRLLKRELVGVNPHSFGAAASTESDSREEDEEPSRGDSQLSLPSYHLSSASSSVSSLRPPPSPASRSNESRSNEDKQASRSPSAEADVAAPAEPSKRKKGILASAKKFLGNFRKNSSVR